MSARDGESSCEVAPGTVDRLTIRQGLAALPRDLLAAHAPFLRILDLSENTLSSLPDWIGEFHRLEVLFLSRNRFTKIPPQIRGLKSLRFLGMRDNQVEHLEAASLPRSLEWLTLTSNCIDTISPDVGSLTRLRKLLLAGNSLNELPESLSSCTELELLRISSNEFSQLPDWIFSHPAICWLAVAGNPCTSPAAATASSQSGIPWRLITCHEELGRGASGITYRGEWRQDDSTSYGEPCAVKVFSSGVSSDGAVEDEMAAAILAGDSPYLLSTYAPFTEHPDGARGLVMRLVPSQFKNLAMPPSFTSVTRDVYPAYQQFSSDATRSMLGNLAKAGAHLHAKSILHGDFYAHNTLVHEGEALLGDFGAACVYEGMEEGRRLAVQRLEVRAFGILAEELIARVGMAQEVGLHDVLQITSLCRQPLVKKRPLFAQIVRECFQK